VGLLTGDLVTPVARVIDNCSKCEQFLNEAVLSADMRNGNIEAKRNRRFHLRAAILNAYLAVLWMEDDVNALKTIDTKVPYEQSVVIITALKRQKIGELLLHPTVVEREIGNAKRTIDQLRTACRLL
jgi:hypothetical protein